MKLLPLIFLLAVGGCEDIINCFPSAVLYNRESGGYQHVTLSCNCSPTTTYGINVCTIIVKEDKPK